MTCHSCRTECRKFGKRQNRQRYQCTQCRKVFTDARDNTLDGMYLPIEKAEMVLSLLLDLQPPVLGQLVTVDFKTLRFGGFSFAGAGEPGGAAIPFIAADQVDSTDLVIDLRTLAEAPVSPIAAALRIEVDAVEGSAGERLPSAPRVVLCCRTGVRAWRAARALQRRGHTNVALIAFGE